MAKMLTGRENMLCLDVTNLQNISKLKEICLDFKLLKWKKFSKIMNVIWKYKFYISSIS